MFAESLADCVVPTQSWGASKHPVVAAWLNVLASVLRNKGITGGSHLARVLPAGMARETDLGAWSLELLLGSSANRGRLLRES